MNNQEIFEAITKNPVFQLATIDNGCPRVRGMLLYRADENGILFHTAASKSLYKQIMANPNVEMCFMADGTQIRISGILEVIDDQALKEEMCNAPGRQFLKKWRDTGVMPDFYKNMIVFCLKGGIATTWTMAENFAPKKEVQL